jgi:hypothetical protein
MRATRTRPGSKSRTARKIEAGASVDWLRALELASILTNGDTDQASKDLAILNRSVERILRDVWPAVDAIAVVLMERKTLSGRQARVIFRKALGPGLSRLEARAKAQIRSFLAAEAKMRAQRARLRKEYAAWLRRQPPLSAIRTTQPKET